MAASTFASKFNSKKDIFFFLTIEVGAYLCEHNNLTIYFLKKVISGEKKCKQSSVLNHFL